MTKKTLLPIVGLGTVTFIIYLLPYFLRFHSGLSYDVNDFASFGTYIGGLGALATTLTLIYLIMDNHKIRKVAEEEKIKLAKEAEIDKKREHLRYIIDRFVIRSDERNVFIIHYPARIQLEQIYDLIHYVGFSETEKESFRILTYLRMTIEERRSIRAILNDNMKVVWIIKQTEEEGFGVA